MPVNLRQLPLEVWLGAAAVIIAAALLLWWLHRHFELAEIALPFTLTFKRRDNAVKPAPSPTLTSPSKDATEPSSVNQPASTLRPAREFGEVSIGAKAQINVGGELTGRDKLTAGGHIIHAALGAVVSIGGETLPPPAPIVSGLPTSRARQYVDRGEIARDLRSALKAKKTATVVGVGGMGGVGKTELALHLAKELAEDSPDNVLWIQVSDRPLADVQAAMARALGVNFPPNADAQMRHEILLGEFQKSPRAVFLDDVRDEFKSELRLCLPPCPPCAVLITSRHFDLPDLPAGTMRHLDVMTEAEALDMLNGVPGLARALAAEPEAGKALCKLCHYHPLALDLAARRLLRHRASIADFNQTLNTARLKHGEGAMSSLAANFELSYAELGGADQARFRRLAVFAAAGFSPRAAAALWGDGDTDALSKLEEFENASMVIFADLTPLPPSPNGKGERVAPDSPFPFQGKGPGMGVRFRLHDLLRDYAADKLRASGELNVAHRAHTEFLITLFTEYARDNPSTGPEVAPELDNLRAAANWAMETREGFLLAQLATKPRNWLYNVFRINEEWLSWLTASLTFCIEERGSQANVLRTMGDVQQFWEERDATLASYEEALRLFRAAGAKLREADVRKATGDMQQFRKEMDAALASYEEALQLFRAVGAKLGEANVLRAIGGVQDFRKDYDAALESYRQALELFRAVGAKLGEANVLRAIGDVQSFRDERDVALESYWQALELFRAVGAKLGEANVLRAISEVQSFRDERDAALESYRQALELFRAVGARLGEANALRAIGDVQSFRDERDAALESYRQALALFRAVEARLDEANVLQAIGDVQSIRRDNDSALESYRQALELFRVVGAKLGEANVRKAIGDVQQFSQEMDAALASYEEALRLFRAVGAKLGEANVLQAVGDVQQFREERYAALKSYEEALRLFRAVGAKLGEANVLSALGRLALRGGDLKSAEQSLRQVIVIRRAIGDLYSEGADCGNFAVALLNLGKKAEAKTYALKAKAVFEKLGEPSLIQQVEGLIEAIESLRP